MRKYAGCLHIVALIVIVFSCTGKVFAEDISLTATVDRNSITINDRLQLTLTIHGTQETAPPSFPSIEGFTLLFGPKISAQTNIINGVVSVSKGYTYVLQPAAKGNLTIGPSTVEYKGTTYASRPLSVEVVDTAQLPASQAPDISKLVFVELCADKNEAYLYEQIILYFRFYFQKGLPVADIDYVAPSTKNFMEEKLGDQRQYEEVRDGIAYNVLELRTALFPMVSGDLAISPAKLKCNLILQQRKDRQNEPFESFFQDTFFDEFFGRGQKRYPVERTTGTVAVKVKPLPEQGRPKEFSGAVGSYNMEVSTKTQSVKVGDPITLSMSVYGEGNIQTINEPLLVLNNEKDFKLYPAESSTQITNREELIRGRKVFSKVIEPQKTDMKAIPAIVFCFFDPGAGQYRTLTKDPMPVIIEASEQETPIQLTIAGNNIVSAKQQVQILTQDILPIMTNVSSLRNQTGGIYLSPFFIAALSVPAIAVVVSFLVTRRKERLQTDVGYARDKRAHGVARKRLAMAKSVLSQHTPGEFYAVLSRSVADYLADKCNIPAASATGDKVGALLKQRGVSDGVIEEVSVCLADFDYRRFSKDGGTVEEMNHALKLAEHLITRLEKQL